MKISLCMIVRDEEPVLQRCLKSAAAVADEIVIIDTGSKDATIEIAKNFTDKIYSLPWRDDFAYARNFAFSKATGDYLLWLDADDVLPSEAIENTAELRTLLEREQPDMLTCPYLTGGISFYRERFLRRTANFSWQGRVHECIPPRGKVLRFDFPVLHLSSEKERGSRNLDIYRKWACEEKLSGRDLFYYGRELYYHGLYTEAIAILEEMLAGDGWYVNKIEACKILSLCREAKGDSEGALSALFRSFLYGEPRAFILCRIGELFRRKKLFAQAAYWYEGAMLCRDHSPEGDFDEPNCRTLIPLLELVVCYWKLGDRARSLVCHKKTEELAPEHPSVLYNKKFFGE